VTPSPQFVFSDDPEYITKPEAAALREPVVPGAVRLYVYNVNDVTEPEKMPRIIVPVIKNLGKKPMHLRMLKYSSQPPSGNYYAIGKGGLKDYFQSEASDEVRVIKPGEVAAIDEKMAKQLVQHNDLAHGLYDFVIDQPGEISVIQTAPDAKLSEAYARIKEVLPPHAHSGAGRGVYATSNMAVLLGENNDFVYDTAKGPMQVVVADGKTDPWILGRSEGQENLSILKGNYGVMYDIELQRTSSDGKGLAVVMWNFRHGQKWCDGMATAVEVNGEVIEVPSDALAVYNPPDAVVVKVLPPVAKGETDTVHIRYSPPGASCLPAPIVFVPVDYKKAE
jgi:hypothetical protein